MEKQSKKKITWSIKDLSSLKLSQKTYSDQFIVGGCKWRLCAYRGLFDDMLLFLEVVDHRSLPCGWRRHARYLLYPVTQSSIQQRFDENGDYILPTAKKVEKWFDEKCFRWIGQSKLSLNKILAKDGGFLVNGELKVVAEVEVLQVIGKLDVSEETSTIMETIDVDGFQLLSSQVGFVRRMFERQPEIASEFRSKNPNLRTGYMSLLLGVIETLRQLPHELHKADLAVACAALRSMTDAGFKLDCLEKKLDEMSAKTEKEEAGETRIQEIDEELKDLKQKCSDLEAELEKKKVEVSAAKAPISFDDVI
ncbi:unnamed protein product [Thlaspi arvense]|uniref:MATH domain-containing protein n=1 Tax=Thlaspi arvense TaxID=13288 RepID=A0AAU9SDZ0_THLAR|nr:unnamed protein product [Thlaspi arvense]